MRVLIIGYGYVGIELGEALERRGHDVCGLRRRDGAFGKLKAGIKPIQADITRPTALEALPRNWDWVVHCVSSGGGSAAEYRKVYVEGMRNVLKWLVESPPQKFVYTSSTSVYGQDAGELVTELSPAEPVTETGNILVETEKLLLDAFAKKGFPAIILRLSGIYGPGRGYWFKQFLKGTDQVEDFGGRILNMVHRDDAVGAIIAALERGKPGAIYNVSDDEPVMLAEFYKWLAAQLGKSASPPAQERGPSGAQPQSGSRRGSTNKRISNASLKAELGYRFKYPTFRQGYALEIDALRKAAGG